MMKHIALVAAMSENRVIGNHNKLPWHIPEELQYFKQITLGKPIIMGRKTYESIGSKPLPNRLNIILSHSTTFNAPGCQVVTSIEEALHAVQESEEIMIIGGATIFEAFLEKATRIYLSIVHQICEGDAYFPLLDWGKWQLIQEEKMKEFTKKVFEKKPSYK